MENLHCGRALCGQKFLQALAPGQVNRLPGLQGGVLVGGAVPDHHLSPSKDLAKKGGGSCRNPGAEKFEGAQAGLLDMDTK